MAFVSIKIPLVSCTCTINCERETIKIFKDSKIIIGCHVMIFIQLCNLIGKTSFLSCLFHLFDISSRKTAQQRAVQLLLQARFKSDSRFDNVHGVVFN